jgi:tetratricopeptide (TPR) repeat protein
MEARLEQARQGYLNAKTEDKLPVGLKLADLLIQAGRFAEADGLLDELGNLAGASRQMAAVMRRRGESFFRQSLFDQAYAVLGEAMAKLAESPAELELFYVYRGLSWVFIRQGYMERARSFCEGARSVLELQADQEARQVQDAWATLHHCLALVEGGEGRKEGALAHYQKELQILGRTGDRSRMVPVYINMGNIYYGQGRVAKALEMQLEALSLLEEDGDDLLKSIILNNLGGLYLAVGDAVKSKEYYRQQIAINRDIKYAIGESFALAGLARAYRLLGDLSLAGENYQQALETARRLSGKGKEASILAELVELRLEEGNIDEAEKCLNQAKAIIAETEESEPTRHAVLQAQIWAARASSLSPVERRALQLKALNLLEGSLNREMVLSSEEVVSGRELEIAGWQLASAIKLALGDGNGAQEAVKRAMQKAGDFTEGFSQEQKDLFWKRKDMAAVRGLFLELGGEPH